MPEQPKINQQPPQPENLHNLSVLTPEDKQTPQYQKMRGKIDAVKEEMKKVSEDEGLTKAQRMKIISGELMGKLGEAQRFKGERGKAVEIIAKTSEGKEIVFNMEQIKQESIDIFDDFNLNELSEAIEAVNISLTKEQQDRIIAKTREGFNKFYLLPPVEIQQDYLAKIKEEIEKPIEGLREELKEEREHDSGKNPDGSIKEISVCLLHNVKPNFPDKIAAINRPKNRPYLLFIKDAPEVDEETLYKHPAKLRESFKEKNETGMTLSEYLIFQRDYTQRHKKEKHPHPDTEYWTWLTDSELTKNSSKPWQVLRANWDSPCCQIEVTSVGIDVQFIQDSYYGARSSVVFEI